MSKFLEYFSGQFDETVVEKKKKKPYVAYSATEKKVVYNVIEE